MWGYLPLAGESSANRAQRDLPNARVDVVTDASQLGQQASTRGAPFADSINLRHILSSFWQQLGRRLTADGLK
ncbi:hypothetical protein MAUB_07330 [Mycolicibacterium aubagnense]|uniref:Uncharacterized protein n=1 Tax=Mycolicibacterium aubagnense TaxID=319707 RepID=A0ABN5YPG3_9MYCO|nr:hypothetical protein MAUB_07330 [Mycolicibacterium aubagnense]